jgi:trk system potassium uptake protein TrkH
VLLCVAGSLLVPLGFAALFGEVGQDHRPVLAFAAPAGGAAALGVAMLFLRRRARGLGEVSAMLLCGASWISVSIVGAIPYMVGLHSGIVDALFESSSGFTTTGITMFAGLDEMPHSILLWRAMTQWIGGLGILSFVLAMLKSRPNLHALLSAESHKIAAPRPEPGVWHTLRILLLIYIGLTVLVAVALMLAGMSSFDAICHSLTTLSTGGFSTHDASIAHYEAAGVGNAALIEYILIVGMLAGGTSFLVHYRVLRGEGRAFFDRGETRLWWTILLVAVGLVAIERYGNGTLGAVGDGVRSTVFQVVAVATTTGFATEDIAGAHYGAAARQIFLVLMFFGGMVSSTAGGVKTLRVLLLGGVFGRLLFRVLAPRGARTSVRYAGALVSESELSRVMALFFAWLAFLFIGSIATALATSHGAVESASGMFSALNNIGPCYISVHDMAGLPVSVKLLYMVAMLAGRLELLPIVLLFVPRAWRRP